MNIFLFILVACLWGGSFIAIKPLVEIVPAFTAATLRVTFAVIFLSVFLPLIKIPLKVERKILPRVLLTGQFAFAIPFALLFWGERLISPGLAGVLNGTVPLFVFILGTIFTPGIEAIHFRKIAGLLVGLAGVILIFYPELKMTQSSSLSGAIAVLMMSVAYAISGLLNRGLFTKHPSLHPFTNLFFQLCSGSMTLIPLSLIVDGVPKVLEWKPISTVLCSAFYLGIASTSIAFVIFYRLIKLWGAVRASTVTYIIPPAALILDFLINGHSPSANEVGGILIVTIGVITLNWPAKAQK